MKKSTILCSLLTLALGLGAQEKEAYKTTAQKFKVFYNAGSYDSIFALFSPEMRSALPQDQAHAFLSGLQSQAGKIHQSEFARYKSNYAVYKTTFDKAVFGVQLSLDAENRINGLYISPYRESEATVLKRNTTPLQLPFRGEWTVFWGGDTKEQNYHIEYPAQKGAFDLVIRDEKGKTFRTNGQSNEDFYAFGQELLAPCDGEVVLAVDGIKDNKPGEMNPTFIPGNTVVIKTAAGEYLYFAHFKKHSIRVREGDRVKRGQLLGLCGNSGNSSEPHLHFHVQNTEEMHNATGAKCYFDELLVNGALKKDHSPVKGEKIRSNR